MLRSLLSIIATAAVSQVLISPLVAADLSAADRDLFEIHARPVLSRHCISCHNEEKHEGNLRLTSRESLLSGGDTGPAMVAGKPGESLIVQAMKHESLEMPPDEQVDADLIAGLEKWIATGAPWPADVVLAKPPAITDKDREWWCFQPVKDSAPPKVQQSAWCQNDVDHFILSRLESEGIRPARQADPLALVRRVHFAITGLPPSDDAIANAMSPDFDYPAMVDRLLGEKAYGENQARFWLDLVRYADTDGYRADHARGEAFRYRDYVIDSFNKDKPYDRFIREQLAGDEIDPGSREALVATMYLRNWIYEHNQRDVETQWHEILNDITETTSDVFLAQGLKCARCHDHKFDPLLQKDFFRIRSFFAAFQPSESHPIADADTRQAYQDQLARWEAATDSIRSRLHEIENPELLKHATREGFERFIPKIKAMIRKRPYQREPYESQIAGLAERQFDLPVDKLPEWLSKEDEAERQKLRKQLATFDHMKPKPLPTMKFVGSDVGPIAPATYLPDDPKKRPITPGFLTLLDPGSAIVVPPDAALKSTGRRTALADWIASESNPLTARVMVNRIWQQHFGRGLVDTSSDFGRLGTPPSHPKLLDWLAARFVEDGWSIKAVHRRILLSATYRQASMSIENDKQLVNQIDPENRLLWRMAPRRLSGEEIHDSVLSASGELKAGKRAIYKLVKRNRPDPLLAAFDAPDRIRSVGKRHRTTTSTQSLLLANGTWANARAAVVAKRFASEERDADFVDRVFKTLLSRTPSQSETILATEFLRQYTSQTPVEKVPDVKTLVAMPKTGSKAIDLKPGGPIEISLKASDDLPDGDFTVEATVLLRSLYKDANVRTIVGHWNGSKSRQGWSLGVTSTKSAYKPLNLILQIVGDTGDGKKLHYEVVPSNLRLELNKPYYVAAAVKLSDTSKNGITFYLRDLSKKDAELKTAKASHKVTENIRPENDVTIGDRFGKHQWDGLIDSIRIETKHRDLAVLAQADSDAGLPNYVIDWQFDDKEKLGRDSSGNNHHAWASIRKPKVMTRKERARDAWVHALLNSNELIYVD